MTATTQYFIEYIVVGSRNRAFVVVIGPTLELTFPFFENCTKLSQIISILDVCFLKYDFIKERLSLEP